VQSDERTAVKKGTGEVELSGAVKAFDWSERDPFQTNVILEFSDADGRYCLAIVFKELDLKKSS